MNFIAGMRYSMDVHVCETDAVTHSSFPSSVNHFLRHTPGFFPALSLHLNLCLLSSTISGLDHIMRGKSHIEMLYGGFIALTCCLIMSFKHVCCQFPVMMFEVQSQLKCRSVGRYQGSF